MSRHGHVPIKLYFWTLRFEFHVIFTCHVMLFFFFPLNIFFFNHIKTYKPFLVHGLYKSRQQMGFGPWVTP